jgi:dTDP-4-amino-4,6-dideoxygalactose transaminase
MTMINPSPLFDLSREDLRELGHFSQVIRSGELFRYREDGSPSKSELLEQQFAGYFGKESAVAVMNGTTAIRLALRAAGVGPGDHVLLSAYSFIACAMAVVSVGAVPVPMDIDHILDCDLSSLPVHHDLISAVLAVHVQGHAVPVTALRELCDERGIPLIEDACQAVGAGSHDRRAGALGDIAVTSFQQAKQISAGEGGLLAGTRALVERAYRLADLGAVRRAGQPDWDSGEAMVGENLRMTEMQAALALDQLSVLEHVLARQRLIRQALWDAIRPRVRPVLSQCPASDSGAHTLLLARSAKDARTFSAALAAADVGSRVVWRKPYPEFGVMQRLPLVKAGLQAGRWPARASALAPRIVSVTLSKYTTPEVIDRVAAAILSQAGLLADFSLP